MKKCNPKPNEIMILPQMDLHDYYAVTERDNQHAGEP
jgi:hypothetical protein